VSAEPPAAPPLVSVVIPTFNREDILGRCLEALAVQTYERLEVVVVDDCSADNTQEVLAEFVRDHPSLALTYARNETQSGANPSRNRAIGMSHGELIAFEDDDCIAEPRWVEALVAQFVSDQVGAVTGIVEDPDPRNLYDLAFRGTHRVYGRVHATRLIAGNMCVRREYLGAALDEDRAQVSADNTVSGRGDEEGLYLRLKARGLEVRVAQDATVLHEHFYSRRSFFRQAYKGGGSAARLAYKYGLPVRIELSCLALAYLALPLGFVTPWMLLPSVLLFGLFAAATLVYNEIWRKKKTVLEALQVGPLMCAYYHLRAAGYFRQLLRLWTGRDTIERIVLGPAPEGR